MRDNNTCRLCTIVNAHRLQASLPQLPVKPVRASHIISRKAIFWTILDEVDQKVDSLFSDTAVALITQALKSEPLHSNAQFIIALCIEHDAVLLKALRASADKLWAPRQPVTKQTS